MGQCIVQENPRHRSKEIDRARRFAVEMPVHFRTPGEQAWREGSTINMSRSGVLFWTDTSAEPGTPVELNFDLPEEIAGDTRLVCHGEIVRTVMAPSSDAQPGLAARILAYRFARQGGGPRA